MRPASTGPNEAGGQARFSARAMLLTRIAGVQVIVAAAALCWAPTLLLPLTLFTFAAFALTVSVLWRALAPLQVIATRLETIRVAAGGPSGAPSQVASFANMAANMDMIAQRLEKWRRRPRRHALTGLCLQDTLLAGANEEIENGARPTLLGLIRVANYEAMAGFDPQAAEAALVVFAKRLTDALDQQRLVAHIDRDCFAIWFRGVRDHQQAASELQALNYVLSQDIEAGALTISPDVQVGSALYPLDSSDAANLLSRAFVSLARPQRGASGALQFFKTASSDESKRRFALEQHLRRAIEQRQLEVHYQPIIDVHKRTVPVAEALLRWRHPTLGPVSPSEFVPILEETGLIEDIGLWTVNTVCRHLRRWRERGLDLKIAVNLSTRQLRDGELAKTLGRALLAHQLTPNDLELELTETAAMEDATRTVALFHELRQAGFSLSLDDFGSGYSNFSYLRTLPFTKLKIDREFVTQVDLRPGSRAICKALVELARGLEIEVLAEGVERVEEVDALRRLGCASFQGFYFAKPMPAAEILKTIAGFPWQQLAPSSPQLQHDVRRRADA